MHLCIRLSTFPSNREVTRKILRPGDLCDEHSLFGSNCVNICVHSKGEVSTAGNLWERDLDLPELFRAPREPPPRELGSQEQIGQFRFDLSASLVGDHRLPISRRQTGYRCPCRPPWATFTGGTLISANGSVFSATASSRGSLETLIRRANFPFHNGINSRCRLTVKIDRFVPNISPDRRCRQISKRIFQRHRLYRYGWL
jgi:hypothetical protein